MGIIKKLMVTMREIAQHVGVSYSTVSFVLSDRETPVRISDKTRGRVLAAAAALGYQRNEMARAMVSGRSRFFGFIVVEPDYEPVSHMLAGALDEADEQGYFVKVLRARDFQIDQKLIDKCLALRLEGVVSLYLKPGEAERLHHALSRFQIPVVTLETCNPRDWGTRIYSDDAAACDQVIEHLHALGHHRIAFIAGKTDSEAGRLRECGYLAAMKARGLDVPTGYLARGDWEIAPTEQATRELLEHPAGRPTAIFCANDQMALVAIRTARAAAFQVPRDLSVVGFTDLAMAELCDPPLTTVAQPFHEMGRSAVRHLISASQREPETRNLCQEDVLGAFLVVRQSSGPAPTSQ